MSATTAKTTTPVASAATSPVTKTTTEQTISSQTSIDNFTSTDGISCQSLPTCDQCLAVVGCMYCVATDKNLAACFNSASTCPRYFNTYIIVRNSTACSAIVTTASTTISSNNNYALPEQPPAWIFGAAGGGFAALLLLIGAISLACWCNKRKNAVQNNVQMASTSVHGSTNSVYDLTASVRDSTTLTGIQLVHLNHFFFQ